MYIANELNEYFDHVHTSIDWLLSYRHYSLSVFDLCVCVRACEYLLLEANSMYDTLSANRVHWAQWVSENYLHIFIAIFVPIYLSFHFAHFPLLVNHFGMPFWNSSMPKIIYFKKRVKDIFAFHCFKFHCKYLHKLINWFIFKRKWSDVLMYEWKAQRISVGF